MIQKLYYNELDIFRDYNEKIFIFSKSLNDEEIDLWDNKILGISNKYEIKI